jgi:hypothetical protein
MPERGNRFLGKRVFANGNYLPVGSSSYRLPAVTVIHMINLINRPFHLHFTWLGPEDFAREPGLEGKTYFRFDLAQHLCQPFSLCFFD